MKTIPSTPQAFHDALTSEKVDRVIIEVCDMAGWINDLCDSLQNPIQIANGNTEGIKNKIHAILLGEGKAISGGKKCWSQESLAELCRLARPLSDCPIEELWRGQLHMELEGLDDLDRLIGALDKKLDALGEKNTEVIRLQTIPGVGPRLSELVVAVIDDPKRFKNVRQVGSYAGLVPRRYQSGSMDRSGRISKAGCGKLRKLLLEIAWGMLRHNAHGQSVFKRISKGQKPRS